MNNVEQTSKTATENRKFTIFYSWQSDLENSTNRGFINDCLEKSIKALNAEGQLEVEPCLDRDTLNVHGSPDIAHTIFDKIDKCHIFVADVSIINYQSRLKRFVKTAAGIGPRPTPNPNVLIELGYAAKSLAWDRIICVVNEEKGGVEQLPFDLRQRRTFTYKLKKGQDKADVRKRLVDGLKDAIGGIIKRSLLEDFGTNPPHPSTTVLKGYAECGPPEVKPEQSHVEQMKPVYSKDNLLWVVNAFVHVNPQSHGPLNVPLHLVTGSCNGTEFEKVNFKSDPRYAIKVTNATVHIEGEGRFQVEGIYLAPYRESDFPEELDAHFKMPLSELDGQSLEVTMKLTKTSKTDWPLRWERVGE